MHWQAVPVQLFKQPGQFGHGLATHRHAAMPTLSPYRGHHPASLFLCDHDWVHLAPADAGAESTKLANGKANALEQVGMVLDQVPGTVHAAGFFVAYEAQDHVARWGQPRCPGTHDGGHHHGDPAFHVQRSPTPNTAICHLALERRMGPGLVLGGHDVDVTVHQKRRRVAAPGQAGDQVRAGFIPGEDRRLESGRFQDIAGIGDAGRFVARWVGGIEADQVLQQCCGAHIYGRPMLRCCAVPVHRSTSAVAVAITTGWLGTCS